MLLGAHPRLVACASMLLMHVFCILPLISHSAHEIGAGARWGRLTPQAGRPLIALRSWAKVRLTKSAAVARKSCIVDVLVGSELEMEVMNTLSMAPL